MLIDPKIFKITLTLLVVQFSFIGCSDQKTNHDEEKEAIASKEEAKRLANLVKRQNAQKIACALFCGTKYDELTLSNGLVLKSVEVTDANPRCVSLMHSTGVANLKYKDLPVEIREACNYDVELEQLDLDRIAKSKAKPNKARSVTSNSSEKSSSKGLRKTSRQPSTASKRSVFSEGTGERKHVNPKGYIKVSVEGVKRGNKTINISGISNVDATLYLNDRTWNRRFSYTVYAGERFTKTWRRVGSKYNVKLKAKTGELLDSEAYNQKIGLGGVDGF